MWYNMYIAKRGDYLSYLDYVLLREFIRLSHQKETLEKDIGSLPCGYISEKKIGKNIYYYRQWREGKALKSEYIRKPALESVIKDIERRKTLDAQLKEVNGNLDRLKKAGVMSSYGLDVDTLIQQVDGSMAIEGMPLTEEDKERIRNVIFAPDKVESVIQGLVEKHAYARG